MLRHYTKDPGVRDAERQVSDTENMTGKTNAITLLVKNIRLKYPVTRYSRTLESTGSCDKTIVDKREGWGSKKFV